MYELDPCVLCDTPRGEHADKEARQILHHKFTEEGGTLVAVQDTPSKKVSPRLHTPTVIGAYDLELRQILINKGLISHEDFTALRQPGSRPAGD